MNNFYCPTCHCTRAFHGTTSSSSYECPVCGKTLQKKEKALTADKPGH